MPKKVDVDWSVAEALYLQGLSCAEIARRLDCNASTVRTKALRGNWRANVAKTREIMEQSPESEQNWKERARNWPKRVGALMEKRLDYLESVPVGKLSMRELRELSAATDSTDQMARRAFELDRDDSKPFSVALNYNLSEIIIEDKHPEADSQRSIAEDSGNAS